ncbi:MAG: hypothetical protein FGM15_03330 [Chthoniobacterales bacterium]|nr:hypothetical protein [Chthoniobacterales bacterium]
MRTRDNMRGQRYGEVIVVRGGPFVFTGGVYNTLGLNNCPEKLWRALDPRALKKQFRAAAIVLNGPRYFVMDRSSLANPGKTETFGGIETRHFADVRVTLPTVLQGKAAPYTENTVARTTEYLYEKGRPIYELIAPDGTRYVMQTYALIVDPSLTERDLTGLAKRLKLPAGWQYRSRVLDRDLVLRARGTAHVVQDDLQNSYQRVTTEI